MPAFYSIFVTLESFLVYVVYNNQVGRMTVCFIRRFMHVSFFACLNQVSLCEVNKVLNVCVRGCHREREQTSSSFRSVPIASRLLYSRSRTDLAYSTNNKRFTNNQITKQ